MKKLGLLLASFVMIQLAVFSQEEAKFTIEVSSDSILLGNYIEVKFKIENAAVENFEAPNFDGFNITSGPNQSSSMMISNGKVTQSVTYSYFLEPMDIGYYYIQPAFVDTDQGPLESIPLEVVVVENPEGIIQNPAQSQQKNLFNREDFFGGDNFFGGNDFFNDFFNRGKHPFFQEIEPMNPEEQKVLKKKKKKRKVYKL